MTKGFFPAIHDWLAKPFDSNGNAFQWSLFVLLLIITAWFWNSVLLQFMRKSAEIAGKVVADA